MADDSEFEFSIDSILGSLADDAFDQVTGFIGGQLLNAIWNGLTQGNSSQETEMDTINSQLSNLKSALNAFETQVAGDFSALETQLSTLSIYETAQALVNIMDENTDVIAGTYGLIQNYATTAKDYVKNGTGSAPSADQIAAFSAGILNPNVGPYYAVQSIYNSLLPNTSGSKQGLLVLWTQLLIQNMDSGNDEAASLEDAYNYLQGYFLKYIWWQVKGATLIVGAFNQQAEMKSGKVSSQAKYYLKHTFGKIMEEQGKAFIRSAEALVASQINLCHTGETNISPTDCPTIPPGTTEVLRAADLVEAVIRQETPGLRGRYFTTPYEIQNPDLIPVIQPGNKKNYAPSSGKAVNIGDFTNSTYFSNWLTLPLPLSSSTASLTQLAPWAESQVGINRLKWDWPTKQPKVRDNLRIRGTQGMKTLKVLPAYYDKITFKEVHKTSSSTVLYGNFTTIGNLGTTVLSNWTRPTGWVIKPASKKIKGNAQSGDNFEYTVKRGNQQLPTALGNPYNNTFEIDIPGVSYTHPKNQQDNSTFVPFDVYNHINQTIQFDTSDAGTKVTFYFAGTFALKNSYPGNLTSSANWKRYGELWCSGTKVKSITLKETKANTVSFNTHKFFEIPADGKLEITFEWHIQLMNDGITIAPFTPDIEISLEDLRVVWPKAALYLPGV